MTAESQNQISWVAVDWGTSNLRLWIMCGDGQVLQRLESDQGMSRLSREQFEPTLIELLQPWLNHEYKLPVICCGMVGARQGWKEVDYVSIPCSPSDISQAVALTLDDRRLSVHILPGVKQFDPADVMRGEETQVAGFLHQHANFSGTICLPGTHSKWVSVESGRLTGFRTQMTGELFALLSQQSILRHSIDNSEFDSDEFDRSVIEMLEAKSSFSAKLFALRARSLVTDAVTQSAGSRLSGLLIGDELSVSKSSWQDKKVALIGAPKLTALYQRALATQGKEVIYTDSEQMTLSGLTRAYQRLREVTA
jgi:2-dehydro-3-deoxygalactonokinase